MNRNQPFGTPRASREISSSDLPSIVKNKIGFSQYYNYKTISDQNFVPPLSVYNYYVNDEGNCSPRMMRPTFYNIPRDSSMQKQSTLPFACIVNCLGSPERYDNPNIVPRVPAVKKENHEPVRCRRCRSYINPFVRFVGNNRYFECNFCGCENALPKWYLSSYQKIQHPETKFGSVEYVVNHPDYQSRKPQPLTYIFVLDVSKESKRQGLFQSALNSLKILAKRMGEYNPKCKIGIVIFSQKMYYFNFGNRTPKISVVGDLENPFLPIPQESLITMEKFSKDAETFISLVLETGKSIQESQNCGGSVLESCSRFLEETGGKILFFSTRYPNVGKGVGKLRDYMNVYGQKNQEKLFVSNNKFWDLLSDSFAKKSIGLDLFLFPDRDSSFIESGMMSSVCQKTNGHLYVYTGYNFSIEGNRFNEDLRKTLFRTTGYDGNFRMRCSQGFDIKGYHGFYTKRAGFDGEVDFANVDEDSHVLVEFEYDDKIEGPFSYLQSALVYTTKEGERVVRVHTLKLPVADSLQRVFKYVSIETVANYLGKKFASGVLKNKMTIEECRNQMFILCVNALSKYRKTTVSEIDNQQLFIPESLKFFPILLAGLKKSSAFQQGIRVSVDQRIRGLFNLVKMKQKYFNIYVYPRLYPLHLLKPNIEDYIKVDEFQDEKQLEEGKKNLENRMYQNPFPYRLPLSAAHTNTAGIYLLDDGLDCMFLIGNDASPTLQQVIFGKDILSLEKKNHRVLINSNSFIGKRISWIFERLLRDRHQSGSCLIFKENDPQRQYFFLRLVEDRTIDEGYLEFVLNVHQNIMNKVSF